MCAPCDDMCSLLLARTLPQVLGTKRSREVRFLPRAPCSLLKDSASGPGRQGKPRGACTNSLEECNPQWNGIKISVFAKSAQLSPKCFSGMLHHLPFL